MLNWKKTRGAETTFSEQKEDTNRKRLVKPCYVQLFRLWPKICGPAQHNVQEALTTSLYTFTYYHKLIFPGLNLLCTTEAAEASFLPVANFLDEVQGAELHELSVMFVFLGIQPGLQWPRTTISMLTLDMNTVTWGTISLWGRKGAAGTCWRLWDLLQKDETCSSLWPVYARRSPARCWLTGASTAGAHVSDRRCLSVWRSPLGFIWCHLGSPQF